MNRYKIIILLACLAVLPSCSNDVEYVAQVDSTLSPTVQAAALSVVGNDGTFNIHFKNGQVTTIKGIMENSGGFTFNFVNTTTREKYSFVPLENVAIKPIHFVCIDCVSMVYENMGPIFWSIKKNAS